MLIIITLFKLDVTAIFRYYVQLPTEDAHEFHGDIPEDGPHRLDPRVSNKVRELVSKGETRLYVIRRLLRYNKPIVMLHVTGASDFLLLHSSMVIELNIYFYIMFM